jgi:hypothetical protein
MYKRALIYLTLITLFLVSCAAASPGRDADSTMYGEVALQLLRWQRPRSRGTPAPQPGMFMPAAQQYRTGS